MNFYIQQSININTIRIGGMTNSSLLHIGSAGIIKPAAHLYNTGGFTKPAPSPQKFGTFGTPPPSLAEQPSVPLQSAVRRLDVL
jgi:spore germination protein PB